MSTETDLLVKEYGKNPINNFKMENCTIQQHEGNFICGDDIIVYLLIKNNTIEKYSFDGNCSAITTAAASFLSELISGVNIHKVLTRTYKEIKTHGFEVSPRRRRAAIIALLAARNAIHNYLKDAKRDEFDDLMDE